MRKTRSFISRIKKKIRLWKTLGKLRVKTECPICNEQNVVKIPKRILAKGEGRTLKIYIPSNCNHKFILFITPEGKIRGYEGLDPRVDKLLQKLNKVYQIKSYIDRCIQFFFENPSKKNRERLKAIFEGILKGFPGDMLDLISEKYNETLEEYKLLMPKEWKIWGCFLIKLLPGI